MTFDSLLSLALVIFLLIAFIYIFIRISIKIRKGGGSIPFLISTGATDAFYNKEKKNAIKMVVEKNAHKKMDEQASSDPHNKDQKVSDE
jgi:hypothetical protein